MIRKRLYFPIFVLLLMSFYIIISCNKKAIKQSELKTDTQYNTFIDYAEKYSGKQNYDSAFYYYNKAKLICSSPQDNNKIVYSLLNMAIIQQNEADYSSSETSSTEAISFFNKSTKSYYKCAIFNALANNYQRLYDYENAIYYYNQALKLATDEIQKEILKNNIAVVHLDQKKYQQAISILIPLSKKRNVIKNEGNYARILDNLGYSYFRLGDTKSLSYLNQSLKIREHIKDNFGLTKSYIHLSEFYKESNSATSYKYSKLAYNKATKTNNVEDRLKALTLIMQNNMENDSRKSSKIYFRINDSLNQARQKAKNQFAKMKYDSTKEKDENLKLKAQKAESDLQLEKQKNEKYLSYFGIILLLTGIIIIVNYFRNRNKRIQIETTYNTETRISKKLHDELANDVFQTMAFAETQDLQNPHKKEVLLDNLDQIYLRTRNISKENSAIHTGEKYETNLKEMLDSYGNETIKVIIKNNNDIDWPKIATEKKVALHRILQELMVNMKKHSQCNFVIIGFENKNNTIEINYSDNGIGFSNELNLKNGLQNVENRIHAIKGTITFDPEPNKGFKAKISFPK